jgi:hypothetical protein
MSATKFELAVAQPTSGDTRQSLSECPVNVSRQSQHASALGNSIAQGARPKLGRKADRLACVTRKAGFSKSRRSDRRR